MDIETNQVTDQIIGAAIEVHRELGPGLLESAYQRALAHEFRLRHLVFEEQKFCSITYKDLLIEDAYRLDFLIENLVVIELKAIDELLGVHDAQVLTYLRFSSCRIGLLFNFRTTILTKHGLRRLAL
jgi:GxxExxY protein